MEIKHEPDRNIIQNLKLNTKQYTKGIKKSKFKSNQMRHSYNTMSVRNDRLWCESNEVTKYGWFQKIENEENKWERERVKRKWRKRTPLFLDLKSIITKNYKEEEKNKPELSYTRSQTHLAD